MESNTWRLVCEDGTIQSVNVVVYDGMFVASVDGKAAVFSAVSARVAVLRVAPRWPVVEILAPGEKSRSELIDAIAEMLTVRSDESRSLAATRTVFDDRAPMERHAARELSRAADDVRRLASAK